MNLFSNWFPFFPPSHPYHLATCSFVLLTLIFSALTWYQLSNRTFTANELPSCYRGEFLLTDLSVVVGGGEVSHMREVSLLSTG